MWVTPVKKNGAGERMEQISIVSNWLCMEGEQTSGRKRWASMGRCSHHPSITGSRVWGISFDGAQGEETT